MTTNLKVTKDGYVYIGQGQWVSFQEIQAKVLAAQNPHLQTITGDLMTGNVTRGTRLQVVNFNANARRQRLLAQAQQMVENDEQHLPHPTTLQINEGEQPIFNSDDDGEHLPLPTTLYGNDAEVSEVEACECEHLPHPSTL